MKQSILVLLGILIGAVATYFIKPGPGKIENPQPFVLKTNEFKSDTAYQNSYTAKNGTNASLYWSAPVDTVSVSSFVRNYKDQYPGNSYCFTLLRGDVDRLLALNANYDLRVYLGLGKPADPTTGTVILTAVNTTGVGSKGGDVYLTNLLTGQKQAIDQASPCPKDCPYLTRDAAVDPATVPATGALKPGFNIDINKSMLGRDVYKDPRM